MLEDIKLLLSMGVEEIISSRHSLTLLKLYSDLYLNGKAPRTCANSQRAYYIRIKRDYEMKKDELKQTHVLKFKGRRYIPGIFKDGVLVAGHLHINSEFLTDADALKYLKLGVLKQSDFVKLPEGAKESKKEQTISELIEEGDYNRMVKRAKKLKLFEGTTPKKPELIKLLEDHQKKVLKNDNDLI